MSRKVYMYVSVSEKAFRKAEIGKRGWVVIVDKVFS